MRSQREASEDHGGDAESIKHAAYSAADFQRKKLSLSPGLRGRCADLGFFCGTRGKEKDIEG